MPWDIDWDRIHVRGRCFDRLHERREMSEMSDVDREFEQLEQLEPRVAEGPSDVEELRNKIVNLTKRLTEVEGLKASANKGFNDEIKDLKADIKMTLGLILEMTGEAH